MKLLVYGIIALIALAVYNFLMKGKSSFNNEIDSDFFAEIERNNNQFLKDVENSPSVKIIGVVSASDVAGAGDSKGWKLVFHFTGWETESTPFNTSELRIEMPVAENEISTYQEMFSSYDVIEIEGKIGKHPNGHSQVLMSKYLGKVTDNQTLNDHSIQLQKPVIIEDSVLGKLTLDRTIDIFECDNSWLEGEVSFSLSCDEDGSIESILPKSYSILQSAKLWDSKTKEFSAKKLLELKNDTWLGEDESEFTESQFIEKMSLSTISFETDGSMTFWFDDGDLFWGHTISVTVDENDQLIDAEIMG